MHLIYLKTPKKVDPLYFGQFRQPARSYAVINELDLDPIIAQNYIPNTKALDLVGVVKGADLINVLTCIKDSAFYDQIERLILSSNQLKYAFNSDSVRLPELPPNLKVLDLGSNQLSGSHFPWAELPETLENLYLQNNHLEGSVNWTLLPGKLRSLWIFGNQLDGGIKWQELPANMIILGVSKSMGDESTMPTNMWVRENQSLDPIKTIFTKSTVEKEHPFSHIGKIHRGIHQTPFMPFK